VELSRKETVARLNNLLSISPPLDELKAGDRFVAQIGKLGLIHGQRLAPELCGYYLLSVNEWNGSLFAIFVEEFGSSCFDTLQAYLYGDAMKHAEALRQELPQLLRQIS
jgi:hypothetical protein